MIPYIENRLHEWAQWSQVRIDGGHSFSPQYEYEDDLRQEALAASQIPRNERCIESEQGVAWLCLESGRLGRAVLMHYRDHPNWSTEMQAQFLRVSRMSLWRYLDKSHALLLGYFIDRAVGICPQTEGLRRGRRELVVAEIA